MAEPTAAVAVRPAGVEDCRRLWRWRNDPETRKASFRTEEILFEEHQRWLEDRLGRADTGIFIVLGPGGNGIGYVRFQISESEAEVSVALDAQERGKGYGPAAIRTASDRILSRGSIQRLVALVKVSHPRSRQAFERAGYRLNGQKTVGTETAWEMVYG